MNINDINLIRAFWSVAHSGSLSATAAQLGASQPTITRQIQSLEHALGIHLFIRSNQGMTLTQAGEQLVDHADRLMGEFDQFLLACAGKDQLVAGSVRISVNEIVGVYLLPAAIGELRMQHPQIQVEVDISNDVTSLSRRDADIALRMMRPTQSDLVAKRLPNLPLGMYGHKELIASQGEPKTLPALLQKPLVGFDSNRATVDALNVWGVPAAINDFELRTENLILQNNLIISGAGFGVMHKPIAKQFSQLQEILTDLAMPTLPFWLVCHTDIQYSKKIKVVFDFLGQWFQSPYQNIVH